MTTISRRLSVVLYLEERFRNHESFPFNIATVLSQNNRDSTLESVVLACQKPSKHSELGTFSEKNSMSEAAISVFRYN